MASTPNDANNVSVGKPNVGGAIFVAPLGTAVPTDASTPLDPAFVNLGFASDAGVTKSNSVTNQSITAWGGTEVINSQTAYSETYAFTLIESQRIEALKLAYGDKNVVGTVASGITVKHNSQEKPKLCFAIEVLLSNGNIQRIVIPQGKVTQLGDVVYQDGAVIPYPITISALPDDAENSSYDYFAEIV